MKVFFISWNDPETVFHEMPWKKNFTMYPSLKNTFFYRTPLVAASEKTPLVMDYIRVDIILVAIYCYLEREIYKVSKYHLENSFYFEVSSSLF